MEFVLLLFLGVFSGLLAGLLGLGGGLIIVPALNLYFQYFFPDFASPMHMALASSLAIIVVTAFSSLMAHHKMGNVNWWAVRRILLWLMAGSFLSGYLASYIDSSILQMLFVVFLFSVATKMLYLKDPKSDQKITIPAYTLPMTTGIGGVSGLVGIGGGTMLVPFFSWRGLPMIQAVGTSAAMNIFVASAGAIGYIFGSYELTTLPYSVGYIYLPALVLVGASSIIFAQVGARWANRMPKAQLKKVFALFLFGLALLMAWEVFG